VRDSEAEHARRRQRRSRSQSPAQKPTAPPAQELPPPPAVQPPTDEMVEVQEGSKSGKDAVSGGDGEVKADLIAVEGQGGDGAEHSRLKAAKKAAKKEKKVCEASAVSHIQPVVCQT